MCRFWIQSADGYVEGHAEGALGVVINLLAQVLPTVERDSILTRVAAHWASTGLPDNVAELVFAVQAIPDSWAELLGLRDGPRQTRDAAPHPWERL